jgi:hypothetical protein
VAAVHQQVFRERDPAAYLDALRAELRCALELPHDEHVDHVEQLSLRAAVAAAVAVDLEHLALQLDAGRQEDAP